MQGIYPPRQGSSGSLEGLVGTNKDRSPRGRVRLYANEPVAEFLPESVVSAIEDVQDDRSR